MTYRLILTMAILSCNALSSAWALVPLESLLLGDFSVRYEESNTDPLYYVFRLEQGKTPNDKVWEQQLLQYKALIDEGVEWTHSCKDNKVIEYALPSHKENAVRSYLATLQFIGLDIVSRALPTYAKSFEFSSEEYSNLVDRLVSGYCSQNLTVISVKELRNNMKAKFDKATNFKLPSVEGNPYFPQTLTSINSRKNVLKSEFGMTIELFKSFCSWGNETDNLRLLVPLVRHPIIMSFVARQLNGDNYQFSSVDRRAFAVKTDKTAKIMCENFICRQTETEQMRTQFPKSLGFTNYYNDMKRLYCSELRDSDYLYKDQIPEIAQIIKERSFDDDNLLASHFFALVSGIPDFLLSGQKFADAKKSTRASMDASWDNWAQRMNSTNKTDLFYEEGLNLELATTPADQNRYVPKFAVDLDVNLGEFDRAVNVIGKITTTIPIHLNKEFASWARKSWGRISSEEVEKRKSILSRMNDQLRPAVEEAQRNISTKILKSDFVPLVSEEILRQLVAYEGKSFDLLKESEFIIPINFNYAPFALKYLRQQFLIEKKENTWKDFAQSLISLKKQAVSEVQEEELDNVDQATGM